jgi:hypothetical protein
MEGVELQSVMLAALLGEVETVTLISMECPMLGHCLEVWKEHNWEIMAGGVWMISRLSQSVEIHVSVLWLAQVFTKADTDPDDSYRCKQPPSQ